MSHIYYFNTLFMFGPMALLVPSWKPAFPVFALSVKSLCKHLFLTELYKYKSLSLIVLPLSLNCVNFVKQIYLEPE